MRVSQLLICTSMMFAFACDDHDVFSPDGLDGGVDGGRVDAAVDGSSALIDAGDASLPDARGGALQTVLELGHVQNVWQVRVAGDRVLTMDIGGRWVLWELATRRLVSAGQAFVRPVEDRPYPPALLGSTLAIQGVDALELRDARDGHLLSKQRISIDQLASDGSYFWRREGQDLQVYSVLGERLTQFFTTSVPGAAVVAGPGELRIASGFYGTLEHFALASPQPRTTRIAGSFLGWFADGRRLLVQGYEQPDQYFIDVLDTEGQLLRRIPRPAVYTALGGFGDFVWLEVPGLDTQVSSVDTLLYRTDGEEMLRITGAAGTSRADGLLMREHTFVDLSRPRSSYFGQGGFEVPVRRFYYNAIADPSVWCDSAAEWCVESAGTMTLLRRPDTALIEPWAFGTGPVKSIAASQTGRVAVTTQWDSWLFELGSQGARLLWTLPVTVREMSADGQTLLVSAGDGKPQTIRLPVGELLHEWPSPGERLEPWVTMSRDGTRILHAKREQPSKAFVYRWSVSTVDGTQLLPLPLPAVTPYGNPLLSPSALRVADPVTGTIYEGEAKTGESNGKPLGWLDDDHLLVVRATQDGAEPSASYRDVVVDPRGNVLQSGRSDRGRRLASAVVTPIDATRFFEASAFSNGQTVTREASVFRRSDLTREWTASQPVTGPAVYAGPHVVYTSDARLLAEGWQ
jgi:hypothetical protein